MGFRIFASGTNNFHYQRRNCLIGSEFETVKVLSILQTMEYSPSGVISGAADYAASGITDLMISLATIEGLHNLRNAVSFLAMNPNSGDGWIQVQATEKNTLWGFFVETA